MADKRARRQLGQHAVITRVLDVVEAADVGERVVLRMAEGTNGHRLLEAGKTTYLCGQCGACLARRVSVLQRNNLLLQCWHCGAVGEAPWGTASRG